MYVSSCTTTFLACLTSLVKLQRAPDDVGEADALRDHAYLCVRLSKVWPELHERVLLQRAPEASSTRETRRQWQVDDLICDGHREGERGEGGADECRETATYCRTFGRTITITSTSTRSRAYFVGGTGAAASASAELGYQERTTGAGCSGPVSRREGRGRGSVGRSQWHETHAHIDWLGWHWRVHSLCGALL